jgi:hypothetical protein
MPLIVRLEGTTNVYTTAKQVLLIANSSLEMLMTQENN